MTSIAIGIFLAVLVLINIASSLRSIAKSLKDLDAPIKFDSDEQAS